MRYASVLMLSVVVACTGGIGVAGAENPLADTKWKLVAIGGAPVVDGSTVTLQLGRDGRAGGSGGCNHYGGEYKVTDGKITFADVASTLMACADDAVTEQEGRYLRALETAGAFDLSGDALTIAYEDGGSLSFERIAPE